MGVSASYVHFDPLEATLRIESFGQQVSAVHLIAGSARLLRPTLESERSAPITLALRPGEALALVAHSQAWGKHVLSAIHRALPNDSAILTDEIVRELSAALDAIPGPSARLLLYRRDATGTPNTGGNKDCGMPASEMHPTWTREYCEFLDRMAVSLV
jgi:hypothetical protein